MKEKLPEYLSEDVKDNISDAAQTCIAHMRYMETAAPEELNVDDFGLRELETAFLVLLAIVTTGDVPDEYKAKSGNGHHLN